MLKSLEQDNLANQDCRLSTMSAESLLGILPLNIVL